MKLVKPEIMAAAVLFSVLFSVYFLTAPPTVSFWDSAELVTCSYIMGIPHPPGSPLLSLLNRIVMNIPLGNIRGTSGDPAFKANLIAVASGALTALLTYLITLRLLSRFTAKNDTPFLRKLRVFCGLMAGFMAGLSSQFWENSTETEAYMPSLCLSMLAVFLILKREDVKDNPKSITLVLSAFYLMGLALGIHLYALLALPTVLVLLYLQSPGFFRSLPAILTASVFGLGYIIVNHYGGQGTIAVLAAVIALAVPVIAIKLYKNASAYGKISAVITASVISVFCLGYTVYPTVMVRAAKNPVINQGAPSGMKSFGEYLGRQQYGQGNMYTGMFTRKADAGYQYNFMYARYLIQQFPKWGPSIKIKYENPGADLERKTAASSGDIVYLPVFIALILLFGLFYHAKNDFGSFAAFFIYFIVSSIGLVLYLNMENPQVRERGYFFLGSFQIIMLWLGVGIYGIIAFLRKCFTGKAAIALTTAFILLFSTMIPAAVLSNHIDPSYSNWKLHDRSNNFIALDYAVNTLNSCDENAILFAFGDNDTFPLWYAQYVTGVRPDVAVVNLSLLNAPWYIKQLRDGQLKLPIEFSDEFIDGVIAGKSIDAYKVFQWGPEPKEITRAGLTWIMPPSYLTQDGSMGYLLPSDLTVLHVIDKNEWKRPVYFSTYVSPDRLLGLMEYMSMEGLVYRLTKIKAPADSYYTIYPEILSRNLFGIYTYRGVNDRSVYKSPEINGILQNYFISYIELSDNYFKAGNALEGFKSLKAAYGFTMGIPERIDLVKKAAETVGLTMDKITEEK